MAERKLDELLKVWDAADRDRDPGKDCPPISVLWLHESGGQPLDEHAGHVHACERCQRRLEIIREEHARHSRRLLRIAHAVPRRLAEAVSSQPVRTWLGSAAAVAACIVVAVFVTQSGTAYADAKRDAYVLEWLGRLSETMEAAIRLERQYPNDPDVQLFKARAFFWQGQVEEAKAIVAPMLAKDPDDGLANLHMAQFVRAEDRKLAAAYEQRGADHMPDDADAWYLRGLLAGRAQEGRVPEQAEYYTRALELEPQHFLARLSRAWAHWELRDFEAMRRDAEQAVAIETGMANVWDTLAVARDRCGHYEQALTASDRAIELDPECAAYYNSRALTLIHLKRFEDALADCRRALDLDSGYWAAHWHAAWAHRFLRNREAALDALRAVVEACDSGNEYENEYRICAAANSCVLLKELDRAEEADELAAEIAHAGALQEWPWALAGFYAGHGSAEDVLKAAGDDPEKQCRACFYIGEFELAQGRREVAREWFQKCQEMGVEWLVEYEAAHRRAEPLRGSYKSDGSRP